MTSPSTTTRPYLASRDYIPDSITNDYGQASCFEDTSTNLSFAFQRLKPTSLALEDGHHEQQEVFVRMKQYWLLTELDASENNKE